MGFGVLEEDREIMKVPKIRILDDGVGVVKVKLVVQMAAVDAGVGHEKCG